MLNTSDDNFRGVATVDIDLTNIDVNQCDLNERKRDVFLNHFRGTHKCRSSTKVHNNYLLPILDKLSTDKYY